MVKADGEIQCLDGGNLQEKWTSPAAALYRDPTISAADAIVEFAYLTHAYAASQGILKGRQDVFTLYSQEVSEDGFNPDLLFLITKSTTSRSIHMVTLPRGSAHHAYGTNHSVESLLIVKLPSPKNLSPKATFSLQAASGTLLQLSKNRLTTFDLTGTLPKEITQIRPLGAQSFLRLPNRSVLVSLGSSLNVYNTNYQSLLASISVDGRPNSDTVKRIRVDTEETNGTMPNGCTLVSYFPKLGTAVGIIGNDLVGIQVESQGKGRTSGLLIDSLGCAIPGHVRPGQAQRPQETGLSTLETYLPGSLTDGEAWEEQIKSLEEAFVNRDTVEFDSLLVDNFARSAQAPGPEMPHVNGDSAPRKTDLPQSSADADRRLIIYALSKIFSWSPEDDTNEFRLSIPFYPPQTFTWLLQTGSITVPNIEQALSVQIKRSPTGVLPSGELVDAVVEIDEDMDLLYALVANNFLGAAELLHGVRRLMESLELIGDGSQTMQKLLINREDSGLMNGDVEEEVKRLEAEVEADLELAEYHLGPGSGVRGEALSLALSKLYTCPTSSIVYALQTTFSTQDIVALIYLLRFELARGAWTTRYLDIEQSDVIDEDAEIPDSSIILISSLLNNCIDAVGAGGWLSGDARLVNGDPFEAEELIASLKLEVSAALEGIEEAVYLRGLTSEMVRYGDAVQAGIPRADLKPAFVVRRHTKPVLLPSTDHDMNTLPLGLKAEQQISRLKVGAGGEVYKRRLRDIGNLKSHKVGKYSLERIVIP